MIKQSTDVTTLIHKLKLANMLKDLKRLKELKNELAKPTKLY